MVLPLCLIKTTKPIPEVPFRDIAGIDTCTPPYIRFKAMPEYVREGNHLVKLNRLILNFLQKHHRSAREL